jgi:hypothetical protein
MLVMETQHTYFSRFEDLWGQSDVLGTDLEKAQYDQTFDYRHEDYQSIIDEPGLSLAMTFNEEEQDNLYSDDTPQGDPQESHEAYQFI